MPRLDPRVSEGYAAYQSGDIEKARQLYEQAAAEDPLNRDAQLGLAAIDIRQGHFESADGRYRRLLEIDPRDPHAIAGLAGLRGPGEPVLTESRLKFILDQRPESGLLHFALGNQLAAQLRWAEAQQSYYRAFVSDPENPDYAYNLAVSLDQLRQPKLASEFYQRAMALASARPAGFDRNLAGTRVQQLGR